MKTKSNFELERVNINLPKKLVKSIKEYAIQVGIPVTSAYIVLLNNSLYKTGTCSRKCANRCQQNVE